MLKSSALTTRDTTLLHPKARAGISRDSAIVGVFVLIHVGIRFLGESFTVALEGKDPWQPFASLVSNLWIGWGGLEIARHAAFWLALGTIMVFFLYFPYSKHIHLFFAPLNFLLKPERRSIGELSKIDFEDESLEQFGATRLEELAWEQLMDAYACIMCYRCQEVCPAYNTGKVLSPAALEINKRYFFNSEGDKICPRRSQHQGIDRIRHPDRSGLGLHNLRGLRRYLPGQQRTDAGYHGHSPLAGADGKPVPHPAAAVIPRHGTHHESLGSCTEPNA